MDTLAEDREKVLRRAVRACARKLRRTRPRLLGLDAGCGAGKWLPFLGGVVPGGNQTAQRLQGAV